MKRFKRLRRPQKLALLLVSLIAVLSATIVPAYASEDTSPKRQTQSKGQLPKIPSYRIQVRGINDCKKAYPFNKNRAAWMAYATQREINKINNDTLVKQRQISAQEAARGPSNSLYWKAKGELGEQAAYTYASFFKRGDHHESMRGKTYRNNNKREYDLALEYKPDSTSYWQLIEVKTNTGTFEGDQERIDAYNYKYFAEHNRRVTIKYMNVCVNDLNGKVLQVSVLDAGYVFRGGIQPCFEGLNGFPENRCSRNGLYKS